MVWLGHFVFCIVKKPVQVSPWLEAAVRMLSPQSPRVTCCNSEFASALCMGDAPCYWKEMVALGLRPAPAVRLPLISCSMCSLMANDVELAGFV